MTAVSGTEKWLSQSKHVTDPKRNSSGDQIAIGFSLDLIGWESDLIY